MPSHSSCYKPDATPVPSVTPASASIPVVSPVAPLPKPPIFVEPIPLPARPSPVKADPPAALVEPAVAVLPKPRRAVARSDSAGAAGNDRSAPLPAPTPVLQPPVSPKPEPLPPPSELPPAKGEPLAVAGKYVVLKEDKLIEGAVTLSGDVVIVRQGALDRPFAKSQVQFVGSSRDEVYKFMLAKVPATDTAARLQVARWCMFSGMREQALTEAREILKLQPADKSAASLARSLELSLQQFPAEDSPKMTAPERRRTRSNSRPSRCARCRSRCRPRFRRLRRFRPCRPRSNRCFRRSCRRLRRRWSLRFRRLRHRSPSFLRRF